MDLSRRCTDHVFSFAWSGYLAAVLEMDTIDRLETSVLKLIESFRQLEEERNRLSIEVETMNDELRAAGETIRNLRLTIDTREQAERDYNNFTAKKQEIKEHIRTIIQRIDAFEEKETIDSITNV